jgi:hypothetical protein
MRNFIRFTAIVLGLSTTAAFAQTTTDAPPPKAPPEMAAPADKAPPPVAGHTPEMDRPMAAQPDRLDRPPPRPGGARYRVKVGDSMIDIRCAADESTKECGQLLLQIIDRLNQAGDRDFNDEDDRDNGRNDNQGGNSRRSQSDDWTRG